MQLKFYKSNAKSNGVVWAAGEDFKVNKILILFGSRVIIGMIILPFLRIIWFAL